MSVLTISGMKVGLDSHEGRKTLFNRGCCSRDGGN